MKPSAVSVSTPCTTSAPRPISRNSKSVLRSRVSPLPPYAVRVAPVASHTPAIRNTGEVDRVRRVAVARTQPRVGRDEVAAPREVPPQRDVAFVVVHAHEDVVVVVRELVLVLLLRGAELDEVVRRGEHEAGRGHDRARAPVD